MRNLKKILALVLALVMSLSLMATAGAASFQDVTDDNPYKTAIDVLDQLKVFQGFEDGSFKPTDTLNRAQAAVLVYRIATGDVEGKQVENYTYMAQSKFVDLDGYNWAKGYINYCQNAKIVVGTDATHFNPGGQVTGYQLMVMLLRTLGYGAAGEFTDPKGWELETAKIAEREGILKNVTGGDFGAAAPRQMVAEILFQGLLQETVQYSALTPGGYTKSGEILGKRVGLEEITGVVIANEIASLIDDAPLAEGKTWLDVDGKTVRLDVSSKGEDLGTMMHAYVKDSKPLTGLTDAGTNDIKTNEGAKTTVSKLKGTLKLTDDTQYFNNFGELLTDTSDYRIEYDVPQVIVDTLKYTDEQMSKNGCTIDGKTPNANGVYTSAAGDTWNKVIRVGKTITGMDLSIIHEIFTWDDAKTNGKVYAGTQTDNDLSDDYSWNEFKAKYLNRDVKDALDGCDIGESLRVIDNDGDGVADYVLRVEFVMTVITDYEKRTETYTVEYDEDTSDRIKGTEIKASDIVCADELAIGDVILYSKIDGVYYVSHPEVETVKVDKKGVDTKAGTFTAGEQTYTWSEIERKATAYYQELVELSTETSYNIYKDWFGFVRLASDPSKDFYLLTDGYYYTNKRDSETKATMFLDGELKDVDVKDFKVDLDTPAGFIDESEETESTGNRGTWLRLRTFEEVYTEQVDDLGTPFKADSKDFPTAFATNIAAGAVADDVYSLEKVGANTVLKWNRAYTAYEIAGTKSGAAHGAKFDQTVATGEGGSLKAGDVKSNDRTLWGITGEKDDGTYEALDRIQTRTDTVYYYVTFDSKGGVDKVVTWTGYNSSDAPKAFAPEKAYAVTYTSKDGKEGSRDYEIASVVVFEGAYEKSRPNAWLSTDGRLVGDTWTLGVDGDGVYGRTLKDWKLFERSQLKTTEADLLDNLLYFWRDATSDEKDAKDDIGGAMRVTDHYADYGVYAGVVTVGADVNRMDYLRILETGTSNVVYPATDGVDSWELVLDPDKADHAISAIDTSKGERVDYNDRVIYMTNADGDVAMIINVTKSYVKGDETNKIDKLVDLYSWIADEQEHGTDDSAKYALHIAEKALASEDTKYLEEAKELLEAAIKDTDSVKEQTELRAMLKLVELQIAKNEAIDAVNEKYTAKIIDAQKASFSDAKMAALRNALKAIVDQAVVDINAVTSVETGIADVTAIKETAIKAIDNKYTEIEDGAKPTPPVETEEVVEQPASPAITFTPGTPQEDENTVQVDVGTKVTGGDAGFTPNEDGIKQMKEPVSFAEGYMPQSVTLVKATNGVDGKVEFTPADTQVQSTKFVSWIMTITIYEAAPEKIEFTITLINTQKLLDEAVAKALASLDALAAEYDLGDAYDTTKALIEGKETAAAVNALLDENGELDYMNVAALSALKAAILAATASTVVTNISAARMWPAYKAPTEEATANADDKSNVSGYLYDTYEVTSEATGKDVYTVNVNATEVGEHLNGNKDWGYWAGFNFDAPAGYTLVSLTVDGVNKTGAALSTETSMKDENGAGVVVPNSCGVYFGEAGEYAKVVVATVKSAANVETKITFNVNVNITAKESGTSTVATIADADINEYYKGLGVEHINVDNTKKEVTFTVNETVFNAKVAGVGANGKKGEDTVLTSGLNSGRKILTYGIVTNAPTDSDKSYFLDPSNGEAATLDTDFNETTGKVPGWFTFATFNETNNKWVLSNTPYETPVFYFVDANGIRLGGPQEWTGIVEKTTTPATHETAAE